MAETSGVSLSAAGGIFPDKYKMSKENILQVNNEKLSDVPDEVFQMANEERIRSVDFSKNSFTTLPKGLALMQASVTELNFSNNLLNSVPAFISNLSFLGLLDLSRNSLSNLPDELGDLKQLRDLKLNNNKFEEIPPCIYHLKSLTSLNISDNKIKAIDPSPEALGALEYLSTLDLRNNNIDLLPPLLGNLRNICTLELTGNSFRLPRYQVLVKGTEAVMKYLRDRIPA